MKSRRWNFSFLILIDHIFISFGLLWLVVEICTFFGGYKISFWLQNQWWLFLICGMLRVLYKIRPRNSFKFKIPEKDISVELIISNFFKTKDNLIIPINNKFIVNPDGNLLNSNSLLSQLVKEYYDSKPQNLQDEINRLLQNHFYQKRKLNDDLYKYGTVVKVCAKNKNFYILSDSKLNENNRSYCNKEILEKTLNELWFYLSEVGGKEEYVIPLLGTGKGRINISRDRVYKEILLSFLASLIQKTYCDKLTICINNKDISNYHIDINHLVYFSKAKINFFELRDNERLTGSNELT